MSIPNNGIARNPLQNSPFYQRSDEESSVTPVETFYILTEDGNIITAENGDRLIQEAAP